MCNGCAALPQLTNTGRYLLHMLAYSWVAYHQVWCANHADATASGLRTASRMLQLTQLLLLTLPAGALPSAQDVDPIIHVGPQVPQGSRSRGVKRLQ